MKIAILGYDVEGHASYDYFASGGHSLTICDKNPELAVPEGAESVLGEDYLTDLDRFDLLVRTAGLHPRDIVAANTPAILDKVTTGTNEFMKACPSRNIVGITGTKGKGTTATLASKMLEKSGKRVHVGGNIGTAALELLKRDIRPEDWVILELSSFQLIDFKHAPHIAVCLMVVPEHLDWHTDFDEYIAVKQQLFIHQGDNDIAIYNAENENSESVADASEGKLIPYMEAPGAYVKDGKITLNDTVICDVNELKLLGHHNWQNACAAATTTWQIVQDTEAMREVLTSFAGLPHRLELVREHAGITYFNDSFASGPDSAVAALEAITGSKVMIVGGYDRGLDLGGLARAIKQHDKDIKKLLVIGASGDRLIGELQGVGFVNFERSNAKTMPEIVARATELAENGDKVLLSPGFASFDMFMNFEQRGELYKAAVNAL